MTLDTGEMCGKWMPRSKAYCGRAPGHAEGECRSPEAMASARQRYTDRSATRVVTPEAKRRWNQKHKLTRYGLTQADFDRLLEAQGWACGMCREQFEGGDAICVDHNHACCPDEKKSCGKCVRGLLCVSCNTALGIIERKYEMARAYLDTRARLVESGCS
jgi:hypothetical protein